MYGGFIMKFLLNSEKEGFILMSENEKYFLFAGIVELNGDNKTQPFKLNIFFSFSKEYFKVSSLTVIKDELFLRNNNSFSELVSSPEQEEELKISILNNLNSNFSNFFKTFTVEFLNALNFDLYKPKLELLDKDYYSFSIENNYFQAFFHLGNNYLTIEQFNFAFENISLNEIIIDCKGFFKDNAQIEMIKKSLLSHKNIRLKALMNNLF